MSDNISELTQEAVRRPETQPVEAEREPATRSQRGRAAIDVNLRLVRLQHSLNPPVEIELSDADRAALAGSLPREAIRRLLLNAGGDISEAVEETLSDPAVLLRFNGTPVAGESVDRFLTEETLEIEVSRAMRGGGSAG